MTWTTKTIKDAAGSDVTMRVWDESGAGTGPFSFGHVISDGSGGVINSVSALAEYNATAPAPVDGATVALQANEDGRLNTGNVQYDPDTGLPLAFFDMESALGEPNEPIAANPSAISGLSGLIRGQWTSDVAYYNRFSGEYETVAAGQTAQVIGPTGAAGDYILGVLVTPATLNPGNIILLDNVTSIIVFTGGTGSVSNLVPFYIPLGLTSVTGAWKITTGASVSVIASGSFT